MTSSDTGAGPRAAPGRPGPLARRLLPNEPRVAAPVREATLTAQYLLPAIAELGACMLAVRLQVDAELGRASPVKQGKAYPLGHCLEISLAVQDRLRSLDESQLPEQAAAGLRALRAFQAAGGTVRRTWGALREQYFQNAFQVGSLYVDVSNDTVTITKPKVEILPFDEAQFVPIRDFVHFRQIGSGYWEGQWYANHLLPELAPHCPLIHVKPNGHIKIHDAAQYMLALTRAGGFAPSAAVLREAPMPDAVFEQAATALRSAGYALPRDAAQGREQALQQCSRQRARRWHQSPDVLKRVVQDVQQANLRLVQHTANTHPLPTQDQAVKTITIDNTDYDVASLSQEAKVQLQSIQFVDQELARLQAQLAVLQTARASYVQALKSLLPPA
ncbi:DUF6447 family protein [Massilia sp. IC2-476]|uniref:DUF6447 family protein n=1 Tax=Massilia sp. IC2-476 TaxID=2887199 RepID=UPI001D10359F|nr:DUF6447 family protein [Massilia sp. IC2-476]MCC2971385.1 DUF6447 family protein [Massilia sp. IC2-476]